MTGTNCDLYTHNQSRSYLNHLICSCSQAPNILGLSRDAEDGTDKYSRKASFLSENNNAGQKIKKNC
jgi:hypothetical protein